MSNICITGGAGFLGQYLTAQLAEEGHRVTVVDLSPNRHAVIDIASYCDRVIYGVDITTHGGMTGLFHQMDCVYHLAGLVSFSIKHAQSLMTVNAIGTRRVVQAALNAEVGRFVHISSVAAIGYNESSYDPIDETYRFDWSHVGHKYYMLSKHFAEEEVSRSCSAGLNALVANPGLMWGPGDVTNSSRLISGIAAGRVPACPPGGTNVVDVRDVASGLVRLLEQGRSGERYILGGSNVTFREIYDIIAAELGVPSPGLNLHPATKPFLYYAALLKERWSSGPPALTSDSIDSSFRTRYFTSAKAKCEIGWDPQYSLPATIADTVAWMDKRSLIAVP